MRQSDFNFDRQPASKEIVERIKKLLRMQRGGTPAEVETALRMARELGEKHNVDLDRLDLEESSPLSTITHTYVPTSKNCTKDEELASFIIARFFNVDPIFTQQWNPIEADLSGSFILIGTPVDLAVAEYVFGFLTAQFKLCWRRRPKRLRDRDSFVYGIYQGICSRLSADRSNLVRVGSKKEELIFSRVAYKEKNFPNIKTTTSKRPKLSEAASRVGYMIGNNTSIRPACTDSSESKPLMLGR